ncbi:peptidoglycan DD-metalloendopeptidase family protein [Neobacillus drentensis]|uniref:peptidoglycan DD-metalloendopeptidase family protein n=1 Tax=Neobacillus drentensis TaxID=220684 RepID=UPI003B5861DD
MIAEVMKMREEENKRSSQSSSVKRFFKKRWVFPAIYIASAALILTAVLWYQSSNSATDKYDYKSTDIAGKKNQEPAIEVSKTFEDFKMPVEKADAAVVKTKFYDFNGKTEDQEAALVFYNNTYQPNTGIDVTMKDDESFNVVASLSGTVTRVEEDAVLGNVIELEHDKGIVTQYQSVKDIKIKVGDEVKQGQVLATAGQSLFNEKAGTHVHFEIRKDGIAVNPTNYFNKSLSTLQEEKLSNDKASESVESPQMKEKEQMIDAPENSSDQKKSDNESSTSTENTNS